MCHEGNKEVSNLKITTEDAFEVGVKEGRKQMAAHILELFEVTQDKRVIKKHLEMLEKDGNYRISEIKQFFSEMREDGKISKGN